MSTRLSQRTIGVSAVLLLFFVVSAEYTSTVTGATATMTGDAELPLIEINDVTARELHGSAVFTVTLSDASAETVTVGFHTSDGTASQHADYQNTAGTVTFAPGDTVETIVIPVWHDHNPDEAPAETFFVNLSFPVNAGIADGQGVGTILNNERATISTIPSQVIAEDGTTGPLAFTISDSDTAPEGLLLFATSGNQTLVPNGNLVFGGAGANRTVTVTPAANQTGVASITIRVSDGFNDRTMSFTVTVTAVSGPGAFGKSAPANGEGDLAPSVPLSWGSSSQADAYEYCVDTSNNNACDSGWIDAGASTGTTVVDLLSATTYYWHVRARNVDGTTESDGGAWRSFTITNFRLGRLVYPSTSDPLPGAGASFAWDRGVNATEYSLWIGSSPGGGEFYKANETGLTRAVEGLPIDGSVVYVRLWSRVMSTWVYADAVYLAASEEGDGDDPTIVPVPADYDGDDKADGATWFGTPGIWFIPQSSTGTWRDVSWGRLDLGDRPVPGDYDGDGKADPAVWRADSGFWYVLQSSSPPGFEDENALAVSWGRADLGDQPVPADYDGDGKTDPAVWRVGDGFWHILQSSTNYTASISIQWGAVAQGDRPMPADYDGDGLADPAVWRTGAGFVYVLRSSTNYTQWVGIDVGALHQADAAVFGDYDGDGEADPAFWIAVSGEWHIFQSSIGYAETMVSWGRDDLGDRPVPGDYDGDGGTDPAVRRSGTGIWYFLKSATGYSEWGQIP